MEVASWRVRGVHQADRSFWGRLSAGVAAVVVGPESGAAGAPGALHTPEGRGDKKSRKKRRADEEAGEGAGPMEVEGAAAEAEVTLGERVAALELDAGEAAREGEGAGQGAAAGPTSPAPRAHSLQVLLTQALASNDGQLLEKCLAVGDEKVSVQPLLKIVQRRCCCAGTLEAAALPLLRCRKGSPAKPGCR
jgi:hypothetical protein